MFDGWGEKKHGEKRINGRGCHGERLMEAEIGFGVRENHFIAEDSLINILFIYPLRVKHI